jgi:6-pyruvoyltetrahydropterin/6-carboxytetrahydropterin synthase
MGEVIVFRRYEFSAAHYLPGHPKCGNMHGHNYIVELGVKSKTGEPLFVDFADIDNVARPIINKLDHRVLNDLISYPSVENISKYIFEECYLRRLPILVVRCWENSISYCEYWGREE